MKTHWLFRAALLLLIVVVALLFASTAVWLPGLGFKVNPLTAGVIGVCALFVFLFLGMPVGIAMAAVGFLGFAYVKGIGGAITLMGTVSYGLTLEAALTTVPLFILMGFFAFYSGLSADLYDTVYKWVGNQPGGLAMATIGACAGFAAVSGTSTAGAATMGVVAMPQMQKYNYDLALATGSVAAGGTLGILIPPSIGFIIYAMLTEQSIGKLFIAGIIPGILLTLIFMVIIYIRCRRNIKMGPPGPPTTLGEKIRSLKGTWGVIVLFLLVMGGIYGGIFTSTEAAAIGAFGAFIFALGRRQLGWKNFTAALIETGKITAMIYLIVIGAWVLGYFLAVSRLPFMLADYLAGLAVPRLVILVGVLVLYVFLGCLMDIIAMIILTMPLIFPAIVALGYDPVWFGVITVIMMEMGEITPPVGINVFVVKGIAKDVPLSTIFRGIMPFVYGMAICVVILTAFPQIALFLPGVMR